MCLETRLNMIGFDNADLSGESYRGLTVSSDELYAINQPRFNFCCWDLIPFQDGAEKKETNLCRYLESYVNKKLSQFECFIDVDFRLNMLRKSPGVDELDDIDVTISSRLLEELYSIMSCDTGEGRLHLKLNAELHGNGINKKPLCSFKMKDLDLFPQMIKGKPDFGEFECLHVEPEIMDKGQKRIDLDRIKSWRLKPVTLDVFIDGQNCPFTTTGIGAYAKKVNSDFLDNGFKPDMKIMVDGWKAIACHQGILAVKSPVIEKELAVNFLEGFEGDIRMMERTEEQVMTFLSFLYQENGSEKGFENASMALTLLEMAHRYDVKPLEVKMKGILMNVSVDRFSANAALQLVSFTTGMLMEDPELERKSGDALALLSDEEILGSEVFNEMFPTQSTRKVFLSSRKRY